MKESSAQHVQVATLVLTSLLLIGLVAFFAMRVPPPSTKTVQYVESVLPSGDVIRTERLLGESLGEWKTKHGAAKGLFTD